MSVIVWQSRGRMTPWKGSGHGEEHSRGMHCFLFILLTAGFATRWLHFHLLCQVGIFPREQEDFSHVCRADGSLSVDVLPMSLVQFCLVFGIDTVNNSWTESVKLIGWLLCALSLGLVCTSPRPIRRKWASWMLFCLQLGSEVSIANTGQVIHQDERQLFWLRIWVDSPSLSDGEMAPGWEVFHTSCLIELLWNQWNTGAYFCIWRN